MQSVLYAIFWICIYLLLVSAPLLVLLIRPAPPGAGFWWDVSMGLGFAGIAVMGIQFALTARFRRASAPFGIDIIYYFHRNLALVGLGLLATHFAIIRFGYVEALGPLNPTEAPWYLTSARAALVLFGIVIVTSLWRKQLRINYDHWRIMHALIATAAVILAILHIEGVGYYTDNPWKRILWSTYTIFWVLLIIHVRLIKPIYMLKKPYQVVEVRPERGRTWVLALKPDGHPGLRFMPGQFAWLTLRRSPFRFKEHPFSFSGSAETKGRLEFAIKELGDFTSTIKDVQVGERAYLDGPYGVFSTDRYPRMRGFVFLAGGVGIAPIMSILRTMADRGDPRPLMLIYASRNWEAVIFRDEIESLRGRLDLNLIHVLQEPPANWEGESGMVDESLLRRYLPEYHSTLEYFICGPKPMSNAVQKALHAMGVPRGQIHFELFDMV
jgi:predicted ferric reductase